MITTANNVVMDTTLENPMRIFGGDSRRVWLQFAPLTGTALFFGQDGTVADNDGILQSTNGMIIILTKGDLGSMICGEWWVFSQSIPGVLGIATQILRIPQ